MSTRGKKDGQAIAGPLGSTKIRVRRWCGTPPGVGTTRGRAIRSGAACEVRSHDIIPYNRCLHAADVLRPATRDKRPITDPKLISCQLALKAAAAARNCRSPPGRRSRRGRPPRRTAEPPRPRPRTPPRSRACGRPGAARRNWPRSAGLSSPGRRSDRVTGAAPCHRVDPSISSSSARREAIAAICASRLTLNGISSSAARRPPRVAHG